MPVVSQSVPTTTTIPTHPHLPHTKSSFATTIPSAEAASASLPSSLPPVPTVKPVDMSPMAASPMVAGPSSGWPSSATQSRFFLVDIDEPAMSSAAMASPPQSYSRCSSEPPSNRDGDYRRQRSSSDSISRTPSIPDSNDSHVDLKSMAMGAAPVPITSDSAKFPLPDSLTSLSVASEPTSPLRQCNLPTKAPIEVPPPIVRHDSEPITTHYHPLRSTQYTDLFLLEPHEYDSIADSELMRLYDRGVIDGRILEQIVDASIRIQRACTDADRAVSIKTRRAMIRHALEE